MAASELSTWGVVSLAQFVHLLIILTAGNSVAQGRTGSHANTLITTNQGHYNITVHSEYPCPRRRWAMRSRRNHSETALGESYWEASRSVFKHAEHCDKTSVLVVSADGSAEYSSIQDAIDQVPDNNTRRTTIYITRGVYEEKVLIPITKPYITLQAEGRHRTVITWNDTAAAAGITYRSASVVVEADHFIARDMSFKNSAGSPAPNQMNMQAAAFRISGDKAFLYQCNFLSYQDTLYDHEGRHYYFRCFIEGSEDFIFGIARSLFVRCWLHSIAEGEGGALVAQGKYYPGGFMGPSGFSFLSCIITGTGKPYLGRAWGEYSTVVYSYCQMSASIISDGWYDWGLPERDSLSCHSGGMCPTDYGALCSFTNPSLSVQNCIFRGVQMYWKGSQYYWSSSLV